MRNSGTPILYPWLFRTAFVFVLLLQPISLPKLGQWLVTAVGIVLVIAEWWMSDRSARKIDRELGQLKVDAKVDAPGQALALVRDQYFRGLGGVPGAIFSTRELRDAAGYRVLIDPSTRKIGPLRYDNGIRLNQLKPGPGLMSVHAVGRWNGSATEFVIVWRNNAAVQEQQHRLCIRYFRGSGEVCVEEGVQVYAEQPYHKVVRGGSGDDPIYIRLTLYRTDDGHALGTWETKQQSQEG